MKKIFITLMMLLSLSGCSSVGGEDKFSASYVRSHITEKKTTQAEVQMLYGVPDEQDTYSDGTVVWKYQKGKNLDLASSVVGYIPGAGAVSSALGMVGTVNNAADKASEASAKMSGNTEHHGKYLYIYFNKNKIVDSWSL